MPPKCHISGKVTNPDGSVASGHVVVFLRVLKPTLAQQIALDPPVVNTPITAGGFVDFELEPNALLSPSGSFYEVHVYTRKDFWTEKWIVPEELEVDFGSFRGTEVVPAFYVNTLKHEADIYNPHLVSIEQALAAQPDFLIPLERVDGTFDFAPPASYQFEVISEGEVLFVLPEPFSLDDDAIEVSLNGLNQSEGSSNDYRVLNNVTIEFNRPLHIGEIVTVKVLQLA